jgi:hypothetical protein
MRWPVLTGSAPVGVWSIGDRVMVRLSWCDAPGLPAEVAVRDVPASARFLRTPDGEPWAQVVSSGDFAAVRLTWDGDDVLVSGCATIDAYLMNQPDVPLTAGIVRRIRLVEHLRDKGETGWVRRPGSTRLTDVTSTGSAESPPPPPDGKLVLLSAEQHFALARDTLRISSGSRTATSSSSRSGRSCGSST